MIRLREENFLFLLFMILIINASFAVSQENRVIGVLHQNWIPLLPTKREREKSLTRFLLSDNHARSEESF